MRREVSTFLFLAILLTQCFKVTADDSSTVRYAAEMMLLPAGSHIAAMGDAGVVIPTHAVSALWNAGNTAYLTKREISLEYANLYEGLSQQGCIGAHVPLQSGIGLTALYIPFLSGAIERYDTLSGTYIVRLMDPSLRANGMSKGTFENNQHELLLSLAKLFSVNIPRSDPSSLPLPLEISAGVNFKWFWQTMNPDDKIRMGMGVNFDAGALFHVGLDYDWKNKQISRELFIGLSIRDFLPGKITWIHSPSEYTEPFALSQYYGLSYVDKSGLLGGKWTVAASMHKQYDLTYHAGIEAFYWDLVAFRAGISNKKPTFGAGLHYRNLFADYALRIDDFANTFVRLSVGVAF